MFGNTFVPGGGSKILLGSVGLVSPAGLSNIPAGGLYYSVPYLNGLFTIYPNFPLPYSGTISGLFIRTGSLQPASGSLVLTMFLNNFATSLITTVPANSGSGTYYNLTDKVTVASGDLIRWNLQNNALANSANITAITSGFLTK